MAIETPSLLITDDDSAFREALQAVLEPQGYRTLLAGDGEEAIEIVRTQTVHVVLLDVHMPRLTGLETLLRLRELRAILPCILLSADLDEAIQEQALRNQAFSVLRKPVSGGQIRGIVRRALESTYNWPGRHAS